MRINSVMGPMLPIWKTARCIVKRRADMLLGLQRACPQAFFTMPLGVIKIVGTGSSNNLPALARAKS